MVRTLDLLDDGTMERQPVKLENSENIEIKGNILVESRPYTLENQRTGSHLVNVAGKTNKINLNDNAYFLDPGSTLMKEVENYLEKRDYMETDALYRELDRSVSELANKSKTE
jgi:hypothetical protein